MVMLSPLIKKYDYKKVQLYFHWGGRNNHQQCQEDPKNCLLPLSKLYMCSWPGTFPAARPKPFHSTLGFHLGLHQSFQRWVCLLIFVAFVVCAETLSAPHHNCVHNAKVLRVGSRMTMWCGWASEVLQWHPYMRHLDGMRCYNLRCNCHMLHTLRQIRWQSSYKVDIFNISSTEYWGDWLVLYENMVMPMPVCNRLGVASLHSRVE